METQKIGDTTVGKWLANLVRGATPPQKAQPLEVRQQAGTAAEVSLWLPQEEVSDVSVARILHHAFMDCELKSGGMLRCHTVAGMLFFIAVRDGSKLLHLFSQFTMLPPERRAESEAAAGRINDGLLFGRAAIDKDCDLMMDACISYAGGLTAAQLVHTIVIFERSCVEAATYFPPRE